MKDLPEESELLAFVDGELPSERRRGIEQLLAARPDLRDRLEHLRALRILSRQLMRDSAPPVSPALRSKIESIVVLNESDRASDSDRRTERAAHMRTPGLRWRLALAASILLCIGIGAWILVA